MSSPDKLIIETPEQTSLEFPLAGLGSRFLALATDSAIQIIVGVVIFIIVAFALPGLVRFGSLTPQWVLAILILVAFLINSGYFAFFEAIWNGQTPGKRSVRLRVMKDDGRPINAYDAIARNLLRIVDQLPGVYAVGAISILFSKQSKRVGDYVAGTVVVFEKSMEGVRPFQETPVAASQPAYDTSRITVEEFQVIETFLNRRDSFDPAVRTSMALQIARRIGEKLGVRVAGWPQTENFLESVHEQFRSTGRFRT
jgi:uncharacterized RDD family membrane protein YckC